MEAVGFSALCRFALCNFEEAEKLFAKAFENKDKLSGNLAQMLQIGRAHV